MSVPSSRDAVLERWLGWLLISALPVFFVALGANAIWEANEAFYVETPRQMILRGDWVTPYWNGELRVNKPVLSYWMVGTLYQMFGVSVAVERWGIAIGAMGIIAAAYLIGRVLGGRLTGILAALVVATAPRVVMFSRRIFIDVWVTCFTSVALACFVLALRSPKRRRVYLLGMYVAIGLGVLTKGPVALVLPAAALALWLTLERRWRELSELHLLTGSVIVVAIVAPWYVALYAIHGWGPVTGFFVGENINRFTSSMVPGDRDILFYLPVLLGDLFPWAPLLIVPLVWAWQPRRPSEDATHASVRRLMWAWIVTFVAAFSLSETKQDLYIFPVVPAVAALVASALSHEGLQQQRAWPRLFLVVLSLLTAAGGAAAWFFVSPGYFHLPSAGVAGTTLMLGGVVAAALAAARRLDRALVMLTAAFVAFNYLFVAHVLPEVDRYKPAVPLADAFKASAAGTVQIADFNGVLPPSFVYYAGRDVRRIGDLEDVEAYFREPSAWLLVAESDLASVTTRVPGVCEVARHSVFETKLRNIVARTPPPAIVLVTNQCDGGRVSR